MARESPTARHAGGDPLRHDPFLRAIRRKLEHIRAPDDLRTRVMAMLATEDQTTTGGIQCET